MDYAYIDHFGKRLMKCVELVTLTILLMWNFNK